jgi:hypothetical protein
MLNAMKKPWHAWIQSPEHDSTHGFKTVRLVSYRCLAEQSANSRAIP